MRVNDSRVFAVVFAMLTMVSMVRCDSSHGLETPSHERGGADASSEDNITGDGGVGSDSSTGNPDGSAEPADQWTFLGGTPGGYVAFFAEASSHPGTIAVGATTGGLFVSDDGGRSWDGHLEAYGPHITGQMVFDPANPNRILYPSAVGLVLFQNGENIRVLENQVAGVTDLFWDETQIFAIQTDGHLYRLAQDLQTADDLGIVTDSLSAPAHAGNSGDEVHGYGVGGAPWRLVWANGALYAGQEQGNLYRSRDGGQTWQTVARGNLAARTLLASGDELWFAQDRTLYYSGDQGETFTSLVSVPDYISGASRSADGRIAMNNDRKVWLWDGISLTEAQPPDTVHHNVIFWTKENALLLGHDEGLLRSDDGGGSWRDSSSGTEEYDLGVILPGAQDPLELWVGTVCNRGLFHSLDGGQTWRHIGTQYMHYVMEAAVRTAAPDELWVTTDHVIIRSTDHGITWQETQPFRAHFHGLGLNPHNPQEVLAGSVYEAEEGHGHEHTPARVLRSTDAGASWRETDGLQNTSGSVQYIEYSESVPGVVLAGTYPGGNSHREGTGFGLFRSDDSGQTWRRVLTEVETVSALAQCQGRFYIAVESGVYASADGAAWERIEDRTQYLVACSDETVIISDGRRVWRSDNAGREWFDWSEGFRAQINHDGLGTIGDLEISADGAWAYLTISSVGFYRRRL